MKWIEIKIRTNTKESINILAFSCLLGNLFYNFKKLQINKYGESRFPLMLIVFFFSSVSPKPPSAEGESSPPQWWPSRLSSVPLSPQPSSVRKQSYCEDVERNISDPSQPTSHAGDKGWEKVSSRRRGCLVSYSSCQEGLLYYFV